MKKSLFKLALLCVTPILIIFVLYTLSAKPNAVKNGFERTFNRSQVQFLIQKKLDRDDYCIGGISNDNLILYNSTPGTLLKINLNSTDQVHDTVKLPEAISHSAPVKLQVLGSNAYFMAVNKPAITCYNLYSKTSGTKTMNTTFSQAIFLNTGSLIARMYKRMESGADFFLGKTDLENNNTSWQFNALDSKMDGGFSTDGMLHYDPSSNRLVYIYYYTNQIVIMDSNLAVIKNATTIDTTTNSKLVVKKFGQGKELGYTLAAPPVIVNTKSCVFNGTIYIISQLKADNETVDAFYNSAVVDRYDISTGEYKGSFYIPYYNREKFSDFMVDNQSIICLTHNHLLIYKMEG